MAVSCGVRLPHGDRFARKLARDDENPSLRGEAVAVSLFIPRDCFVPRNDGIFQYTSMFRSNNHLMQTNFIFLLYDRINFFFGANKMTIEINNKTVATNANGYLENIEDWSQDVAKHIAGDESLELTNKHWDLINYLRDEFINDGDNQPNARNMVKTMGKKLAEKINAKTLYDLFPGDPSKQGGRISGLPESLRKGGY